jgi:hypothetical protein
MSYHQGSHELRLAISSEAGGLVSDFGVRQTVKRGGAQKRQLIPSRGIGVKVPRWTSITCE